MSPRRPSLPFQSVRWVVIRRVQYGRDESLQPGGPTSIDKFHELVAAGHASVDDAYHLLQTAKNRITQQQLPRNEALNIASKARAGSILQWLWNRPKGTRLQDYDQPFTNVLAYHLYAEGLERFIWEWIELEARACISKDISEEHLWSHNLLASLVQAHVEWSVDGTANSAPDQLESAVPMFNRLRRPPTVGAIVVLQRFMSRQEAPPCDAAKFERYLDILRSGFHRQPRSQLDQLLSALLLYHPTKADPLPALKFFQARYAELDGQIKSHAARNSIGSRLLRTSFLLRLQERTEDAIFLESLVESHHPLVWQHRHKTFSSNAQNPKLRRWLHGKKIPRLGPLVRPGP